MSVRNQSRRMHGARVLSIGSDPGSCLGEFEHYLAERGYAARTIALYMNGIEPFARWLSRCEADMSDLDEAMIARFLGVHRFDSRCGLNCGRAALRHLLGASVQRDHERAGGIGSASVRCPRIVTSDPLDSAASREGVP
mgnify:CR=1 FL=1